MVIQNDVKTEINNSQTMWHFELLCGRLGMMDNDVGAAPAKLREEKSRFAEEKSRFPEEKSRFPEENKLLEEKSRFPEEKSSFWLL